MVDNNITIMTWDPKVWNNTDVQGDSKDVTTAEVEKESEGMSAEDVSTISDFWSVQHRACEGQCSRTSKNSISHSRVHYTHNTPPTGHKEALFEPCVDNPQARILYPGVVSLYEIEGEKKSLFTVQYINIEQQCCTTL